jgi:hypothetical protein
MSTAKPPGPRRQTSPYVPATPAPASTAARRWAGKRRDGTDSTNWLQLTAAEMSAIAASFNDKSETKAVIANGVKVNGEKYMTIESSEDSLKAKKVRL